MTTMQKIMLLSSWVSLVLVGMTELTCCLDVTSDNRGRLITSPTTWWQMKSEEPVDFSDPYLWDKIGIPVKAGADSGPFRKGCHITEKESWPELRCWERRNDFYPMKFRAVVLAAHGSNTADITTYLDTKSPNEQQQDIVVLDEVVVMSESSNPAGTYFQFIELKQYGSNDVKARKDITLLRATWPDNWKAPLDYSKGNWVVDVTWLEGPTSNNPALFQFCIWDLLPTAGRETCTGQFTVASPAKLNSAESSMVQPQGATTGGVDGGRENDAAADVDDDLLEVTTDPPASSLDDDDDFSSSDEADNLTPPASSPEASKLGGRQFSPDTVRRPFPRDDQMENFIRQKLSKMSLRQKVGQMIQQHHGPGAKGPVGTPGESYITFEMLRDQNIGMLKSRTKSNHPQDWVQRAEELQGRFWTDQNLPDYASPAMWFIEAVHGHSALGYATIMPHNIGLGCTRDPWLLQRIGNVTARELTATGYDATFGHCVAVAKSNRWGRVYESFSQDPEIAAELAYNIIIGLQGDPTKKDGWNAFQSENKIIASAKHVIGDGATSGGVDGGVTEIPMWELKRNGLPYVAAIEAGVQAMMVNKGKWKKQDGGVEEVHGSWELLTGLVKNQWGFDGVLYSDWMGWTETDGCSETSCAKFINAGGDAFMQPFWWAAMGLIDNTVRQVETGQISQGRIDDAVLRILRMKYRNRMLPGQPGGMKQAPGKRPLAGKVQNFPGGMGSPEHRSVGREAVRKSLILLKNKNNVLPMRKGARVMLSGNGADSIIKQCGSWTVTWQGYIEANSDRPGKDWRSKTGSDDYPVTYTDRTLPNDWFTANGAQSVLMGMRDIGGGNIVHSEWADAASTNRFDYHVVVLAEDPYAEWEGDVYWPRPLAYDRQSPGNRYAGLVDKLRREHPEVPLIVVLMAGRPQYVNNLINRSDAFVVAWLPGTEARGIADVLYGDYDFTGRLSFAWPIHPCQDGPLPPQDTLYPLGYRSQYKEGALDVTLRECNPDNCRGGVDQGCLEKNLMRDATRVARLNTAGEGEGEETAQRASSSVDTAIEGPGEGFAVTDEGDGQKSIDDTPSTTKSATVEDPNASSSSSPPSSSSSIPLPDAAIGGEKKAVADEDTASSTPPSTPAITSSPPTSTSSPTTSPPPPPSTTEKKTTTTTTARPRPVISDEEREPSYSHTLQRKARERFDPATFQWPFASRPPTDYVLSERLNLTSDALLFGVRLINKDMKDLRTENGRQELESFLEDLTGFSQKDIDIVYLQQGSLIVLFTAPAIVPSSSPLRTKEEKKNDDGTPSILSSFDLLPERIYTKAAEQKDDDPFKMDAAFPSVLPMNLVAKMFALPIDLDGFDAAKGRNPQEVRRETSEDL